MDCKDADKNDQLSFMRDEKIILTTNDSIYLQIMNKGGDVSEAD